MAKKVDYANAAMNSFRRNLKKAEEIKESNQEERKDFSEDDAEESIEEIKPLVKKSPSKSVAKKDKEKAKEVNREGYIHYGMMISQQNIDYLKKIKRLEGEALIDIINGIIQEHRESNEVALDATIAELEKKSKSWRK